MLSPSEILASATYMLHLANGEAGYRYTVENHDAGQVNQLLPSGAGSVVLVTSGSH